MEWMLQVVDELDDAVAIVRHTCSGVEADIRVLFVRLAGLVTPRLAYPRSSALLRRRSAS